MQLFKGHFKYGLYKLISIVFASFASGWPTKYLLPVLVFNLRNDFYLFGWPCNPFSCLRNLCLPLCLFCHLISLSDAEIRWCFIFYFLWQDESVLGIWVEMWPCHICSTMIPEKNLRSNSLYIILFVMFYVPHHDKIEMIATVFISFDKFWKTYIVYHNSKYQLLHLFWLPLSFW